MRNENKRQFETHRLNYDRKCNTLTSTYFWMYQVSSHQNRSTDHLMSRLDFDVDSLYQALNQVQGKVCYRMQLKITENKRKNTIETLSVIMNQFPILIMKTYIQCH